MVPSFSGIEHFEIALNLVVIFAYVVREDAGEIQSTHCFACN